MTVSPTLYAMKARSSRGAEPDRSPQVSCRGPNRTASGTEPTVRTGEGVRGPDPHVAVGRLRGTFRSLRAGPRGRYGRVTAGSAPPSHRDGGFQQRSTTVERPGSG